MLWNALISLFENKNTTLLQIGANDGISHGDEYLFKKISSNKNWHCVLIEPVEENMLRLKNNYSNFLRDNIFFEQIAIGETDSEEIMYSNLESDDALFGALSTFQGGLVDELWSNVNFTLVKVLMKPFLYIKDKYEIDHIDILQIDTEGYDYKILKQIFSNHIFPSIIKAEMPSYSQALCNQLIELVTHNGYGILSAGEEDIILIRLSVNI